ncbi:MAG TPA: DUF4236 domain-containing protein [Longimicrobium sp.]|nr:DUF4236 domain-containing protein [Longimicrobium sp.]
MGFRIRKSIKAGPFRFNLSGSGVGVSVGIPGLRVGTGPRGNYVHVGGGGLYYRATLPSRPRPSPGPNVPPPGQALPQPAERGAERFERIESADVLAMTDASAAGLLDQVRAAETRTAMAPLAGIVAGFTIMLLLAGEAPGWLAVAAALIGTGLAAWLHVRDLAGRTVVLFYDLEPDAQAAYQEVHAAFARLARAHGAWNVQARADTQDRRRNAGATQLVQRQSVRLGMGVPAVIRTNVDVPAIPCGAETLHFFPDRLLVSSPQGIGAIPYHQLEITVESHPFIEEERVPADASQVGTTWRYVNRNGSPDRRFADNRQLPVLLYEQVAFTSPGGLREVVQLSATGGGNSFRSAIEALGRLARVKAGDSPRRTGGGTEQGVPAPRTPVLPAPAGAFEGVVSGDVDCRLGGRAVFGHRSNGEKMIFFIVLRHTAREGDGEHAITLSNALAGFPAPGRYSLGEMGPRTFVGMYAHETEGGASGTYLPQGEGVLVIESATADRVHGSVEFRAEGTNTYNVWAVRGDIRLRATFTAAPTEGDPYALARLPGELRALAGTEDVEGMDAGEASDGTGSMERFAAGVVRHMVMPLLPHLLEIFANAGLDEPAVRSVEAFLFAALPFDALLATGHFGAETGAARAALRRAVAAQAAAFSGTSPDGMVPRAAARLEEYAAVVFEAEQLRVRKDGMQDLAHRAYAHIVGGETEDYALLEALFTYFGSVSESLGYGERLAEVHDAYQADGDDVWEDDALP